MENLLKIDLSPKTKSEAYAWMTCAILAHTQMGARFTEAGAELVKEIKASPEAFLKVVDKLQETNKLGFAELDSEEAQEIKEWVKQA